jgi:hypothetical protein
MEVHSRNWPSSKINNGCHPVKDVKDKGNESKLVLMDINRKKYSRIVIVYCHTKNIHQVIERGSR